MGQDFPSEFCLEMPPWKQKDSSLVLCQLLKTLNCQFKTSLPMANVFVMKFGLFYCTLLKFQLTVKINIAPFLVRNSN